MELFQKDKSRLRSRCAVTGSGDYLTAEFGANIPGGENAGNTCAHFRIRYDEALVVALKFLGQKRGYRCKSHIDEKSVHRQFFFRAVLNVAQAEACQLLIAIQACDDRVTVDFHLVGHALQPVLIDFKASKALATMDQVQLAHDFGKIQRFFKGGIAAAHYRHRLPTEEITVAEGTVGDAASDQTILILQPQLAMTRPGTDEHRFGGVFLTASGAHIEPACRAGNGFHGAGRPVNVEAVQMGGKKIGQLITLDALGVAGVIFKGFGLQNLAARSQLLKERY